MVQLLFLECGTLFLVRGKSAFALLIPCRSAYWILKFIFTEISVTLEAFSQYRELLCLPIWLPYFWGVFLSACVYIYTHMYMYICSSTLPLIKVNMCTMKSLCWVAKLSCYLLKYKEHSAVLCTLPIVQLCCCVHAQLFKIPAGKMLKSFNNFQRNWTF